MSPKDTRYGLVFVVLQACAAEVPDVDAAVAGGGCEDVWVLVTRGT